MIEIVTIFLGLATGPQPVELAVHAQAAEIEVLLDGQVVETLTSPPWRLEIDLGEVLLPHRLVAVARDDRGHELASAQRWINIDMPQVEIGGRTPSGGLTPLPVLFGPQPLPSLEELGAWFFDDGKPLAVRSVQTGPAEVVIVQDPATRRGMEQLARVYLAYQLNRLGFRAEPLRADSPAWNAELLRLPKEEFRQAGLEAFRLPGGAPENRQLGLLWLAYQEFAGLGDETEVRFISPLAAPISRSERQRHLFLSSAGVSKVGLLWLGRKLRPMSFAYRFADAVAIAGREAHASGRRRAVVLLLHGDSNDDSLYSAAAAREYLRALRVPLFIWSLSPAQALSGWGEHRFIGFQTSTQGKSIRSSTIADTFQRLDEATAELRRTVESQSIVWLAGEHLPSRIGLTDAAAGARPAGIEPPIRSRDHAGGDGERSRANGATP